MTPDPPAPLDGRRVAVLRVGTGEDAVADALAARGADARSVSVGSVADRADDELREEVGELALFAWVAVTSVHAARRLTVLAPWPASTSIAAVGPATEAAVEALGLRCAARAPEGTAASLASVLDGGPVLFLAASSAREDLARALAGRDVELVTVVAYDVVARALDDNDAKVLSSSDAIVALSPLAVDALDGLDDRTAAVVARLPLVVIGPTTEARAVERRRRVARRAEHRDPWSVCDAVADALDGPGVVAPGASGARR